MSSWFAVIPLHGFVFCGSATLFYQRLQSLLAQDQLCARCERPRKLLLDCDGLTGVDPTAVSILAKARRFLLEHRIEVIWAGLGRHEATFAHAGLLESTQYFHTADLALKWIEDELLRRGRSLADHVFACHPTLERIRYRSTLASVFSVATSSPDRLSSARLLRHATRLVLERGEVIFDAEKAPEPALFLLFVGEVDLLEQHGGSSRGARARTLFPGSFFNQHFTVLKHSDSSVAPQLRATALSPVVLLRFSQEGFQQLERSEPHLALQLLRAIIQQGEMQRLGRRRPVPAKRHAAALAESSLKMLGISNRSSDPDRVEVPLERVELTGFQSRTFTLIFDLMDGVRTDDEKIQVEELEAYTTSVGRTVPAAQLANLFQQQGWDVDGDGTLSRSEFLELARVSLVADLPKSLVTAIESSYAATAAAAPGGVVHRTDIPQLLGNVGYRPCPACSPSASHLH